MSDTASDTASDPVLLSEAKAFLRVTHDDEDATIQLFLEAAKARIETEVGQTLTETAPAPLRLAILYLVAEAYDGRGDAQISAATIAAWISPYRRFSL